LAWGACKIPDSAYLLGFLGDHKNETDTATGLESADILASSCYFQMQKEFSRPYSPLSRYPRGNIHVNGSMGGATYKFSRSWQNMCFPNTGCLLTSFPMSFVWHITGFMRSGKLV